MQNVFINCDQDLLMLIQQGLAVLQTQANAAALNVQSQVEQALAAEKQKAAAELIVDPPPPGQAAPEITLNDEPAQTSAPSAA